MVLPVEGGTGCEVWIVVDKMQGNRTTYYKSMIQESSDGKEYLLVNNTEMVNAHLW